MIGDLSDEMFTSNKARIYRDDLTPPEVSGRQQIGWIRENHFKLRVKELSPPMNENFVKERMKADTERTG